MEHCCPTAAAAPALGEGHRHCFSTHGVPYVSILLHTLLGLHTGRSASELWNGRDGDEVRLRIMFAPWHRIHPVRRSHIALM